MTTDRDATTTILFSDLVGSTELLERAGDEDAQRLFKAHYQLLRDAVSQHGGAEVKSLGDGLMVVFASAADAVRCAIAMQQMSRRPVNGEHVAIRVGLNAQRTDHLDVIERNLREKVIAPDFRYPMFDGRMALGRLCALTGRYEEASEWFAKARTVLDEQGARPLRAIVDYDEALMYVRRNADGDAQRALPLLDAALVQFRQIGMTGWVTRAEELRATLAPSTG